jgi:hypothetical protein
MGAPMIQPTKDELRLWLSESRQEARDERQLRKAAEYKLNIAIRKLGEAVIEKALQEELTELESRPQPKLLRRV